MIYLNFNFNEIVGINKAKLSILALNAFIKWIFHHIFFLIRVQFAYETNLILK